MSILLRWKAGHPSAISTDNILISMDAIAMVPSTVIFKVSTIDSHPQNLQAHRLFGVVAC